MEEMTVLIAEAQRGNNQAREVLIEKNLGLVHHIVKRFIGRGVESEDLFQIGSIGLMKAIDKFDLSFDVRFSTYAVPMIQGELKRYLRDDGMVKVSRNIKENSWKVAKAAEKLNRQLGREATIQELSKETELEPEEIVVAMEASQEVDSIYRSVYQSDGNEICLVDKIPVEKDEQEGLLNRILLEQLMGYLDEQGREIIRLRYYENVTQVEVAKKLGISQVQVSRLEKKILKEMRMHLQE